MRLLLSVLLLMSVSAAPTLAQAEPSEPAPGAPEIASRLRPSVVRLVVGERAATGLKVAGGVMTTASAVGSATEVELISSSGVHGAARLVRTDRTRNLALLSTDLELPAATFEPAAAQRQGDEVVVLAYSLGAQAEPVLTGGVVSGVRQTDFGLDLVQTDAAINAGSAGGPIVNMRGAVIGLVSHSAGPGLNFGVASESVSIFLAGGSPLPGSLLPDEPRPTPPSAASGPPPPAFAGTADEASVRPADLGGDWSVADQQREPADDRTTGVLRTVLRKSSGDSVRVLTAVYRSRELALAAWGSRPGGSLETCEGSVYTGDPDAVSGSCLVQNVILEMRGASYDTTRAAFAAAWKRIMAASTRPAAAPTPGIAQFKVPPSAIAASAGDVGAGWSLRESQQEQAGEYSTGRLRLWFVNQAAESLFVDAEVFRDADTAEAGVQQLSRDLSGPKPEGCDSGLAAIRPAEQFGEITFPPASNVTCRVANVGLRVVGGTPDLGRSLVAIMVSRVKPALQ